MYSVPSVMISSLIPMYPKPVLDRCRLPSDLYIIVALLERPIRRTDTGRFLIIEHAMSCGRSCFGSPLGLRTFVRRLKGG